MESITRTYVSLERRIPALRYIIAMVVLAIIAITYVYMTHRNAHRNAYETYLYGFWVGDDGFCEESDVSSMLLFIGDPADANKSRVHRDAYLIINNDVTNQPIEIDYSAPTTGHALQVYKFPAKLKFSDEDVDIPANVQMELDIVKGRLRIHDGETIYGVFYKDHEVSELLRD